MPSPPQNPRPFTKAGIEILSPDQNGVYGIFRNECWIYVGRGDIRAQKQTAWLFGTAYCQIFV